jgi:hypothetical protein
LIVSNLLNRDHFTFGTFNVNRGAGGLVERFLTPGEPRSAVVTVRWGRMRAGGAGE